MSVNAAASQAAPSVLLGRFRRPGIAWPKVVLRASALALALLGAFAVVGAGWPPVLLVVPVAVVVLLVASARKLHNAASKIDSIFDEELDD